MIQIRIKIFNHNKKLEFKQFTFSLQCESMLSDRHILKCLLGRLFNDVHFPFIILSLFLELSKCLKNLIKNV